MSSFLYRLGRLAVQRRRSALLAWLVVGTLATVLVTEQRRALTSKQLRLGSILSVAT